MDITVEQKIKYAGWVAKAFMIFGVIFIGWGFVVHNVQQNYIAGNSIAGTGLVFVALFGVFVYLKKRMEKEVEGERPYFDPYRNR